MYKYFFFEVIKNKEILIKAPIFIADPKAPSSLKKPGISRNETNVRIA